MLSLNLGSLYDLTPRLAQGDISSYQVCVLGLHHLSPLSISALGTALNFRGPDSLPGTKLWTDRTQVTGILLLPQTTIRPYQP